MFHLCVCVFVRVCVDRSVRGGGGGHKDASLLPLWGHRQRGFPHGVHKWRSEHSIIAHCPGVCGYTARLFPSPLCTHVQSTDTRSPEQQHIYLFQPIQLTLLKEFVFGCYRFSCAQSRGNLYALGLIDYFSLGLFSFWTHMRGDMSLLVMCVPRFSEDMLTCWGQWLLTVRREVK